MLSDFELERLTRRYAAMIMPILGGKRDIPAPDVNTNPRIMAWFMDTVSMIQGHHSPEVITGKPVELGGSLGRVDATGRGVAIATIETLQRPRPRSQGHPCGGARVRQCRILRGKNPRPRVRLSQSSALATSVAVYTTPMVCH